MLVLWPGGPGTGKAGHVGPAAPMGPGGPVGPVVDGGEGGQGSDPSRGQAGTRQRLRRRSIVTRSWLKATPMAEIVTMPAYIWGMAKLNCEALIR